MVSIKEINKAISEGHEYFRKNQNEDGSWSVMNRAVNEPLEYYNKVALTAQAILALCIDAETEDLDIIKKGIKYLLNDKVAKDNPLQWLAYVLQALYYSNTQATEKYTEEVVKYILDRQNKNGSWKLFLRTDTTLSTYLIQGLYLFNQKTRADKGVFYLLKHPAKDGKGWGLYDDDTNSHVTFTSNIIENLVISGVPWSHKDFKKCEVFLKETQNKDGGWPSSSYTEGKKSTVYGTALAVFGLILTCEGKLDSQIEKGIKLILSSQNKDNGWPNIIGKKSMIYSTYFAIRTLSFYKQIKENRDSNIFSLYRQFHSNNKQNLEKLLLQRVLSSRILGSTIQAVRRRLDVLEIISNQTQVSPADVIDLLKKKPEYSKITKRAYLTQIQLDLEYLRNLKLIDQDGYMYYMVYSFLN